MNYFLRLAIMGEAAERSEPEPADLASYGHLYFDVAISNN